MKALHFCVGDSLRGIRSSINTVYRVDRTGKNLIAQLIPQLSM